MDLVKSCLALLLANNYVIRGSEDFCTLDSCAEDDMVLIRGGVFTMGSDVPVFVADGEAPARRVQMSNFFMDKYEVSNAKFAEFVQATKHKTEAETFGNSFVMDSYLSPKVLQSIAQAVKGM